MKLLLPPMLNAELSPGLVRLVPADEAMKLLLPERFVALLPTPVAIRGFPGAADVERVVKCAVRRHGVVVADIDGDVAEAGCS